MADGAPRRGRTFPVPTPVARQPALSGPPARRSVPRRPIHQSTQPGSPPKAGDSARSPQRRRPIVLGRTRDERIYQQTRAHHRSETPLTARRPTGSAGHEGRRKRSLTGPAGRASRSEPANDAATRQSQVSIRRVKRRGRAAGARRATDHAPARDRRRAPFLQEPGGSSTTSAARPPSAQSSPCSRQNQAHVLGGRPAHHERVNVRFQLTS